MNRASSATGWVLNPVMKSPELDPGQASSYELGWTWNPITGCLNHTPEGLCLGGLFPCYAYRLSHGRLRERYLANMNIPSDTHITSDEEDFINILDDPFYPRFWPERLSRISQGTPSTSFEPKGIFVCDMGELFGDWVPREWQEEIFQVIRGCKWHRFYLLTKQAQNLPQWSPFPDNCWVGVTVTRYEFLADAIANLAVIKAGKRYLSLEPLLEPIPNIDGFPFLDWLIIGAQTKPYKPPKIEWVEEIVRAADKAGVPVFLKDNLVPLLAASPDPGKAKLFYSDMGLRQEVPC